MALKFVGESFVSGAIQLLLERIASPEFVNYFLGKRDSDLEGLVKRIKIMVTSLTGVLDDAEQRQIRNDPRVEAWLDDVQEAVFDADDLLDEIETDALQCKVEGESSAGTSEVRETKRQKVFNLFSRSRKSNERDVENQIKQLLDRLEGILKEKDLLGLKENSVGWQRLPSTSLVDESEVYGRDDDKEAVIELLLSDAVSSEKICVIPIVGMGGVGKTTLAQAVFNDRRVAGHFDLKSWVCVSEDFDVFRVTSTLLDSESSSSARDARDLNSLQVELREKLAGKKFLIVLDDVWDELLPYWDVMRMPFKDGAQGSKIIVTTRIEEVASIMGTHTIPVHHLNALAEEDSWKLFVKHTFGSFTTNPDLERIGREIVKKCKGLPLAVKTLGGLLRSNLDIDHWEGILKSEIWELTDKQNDILPSLRLSYHYLPSHLKRCFAYCLIFPKDYKFDKR